MLILKKNHVFIPEALAEKSLKKSRPEYNIYNRDGDVSGIYGGDNLLLTSGAAAIRILENEGKYRSATLKDLENLTKIHDYYPLIDIIHTATDATDIPENIMRAEMAATVFKNTSKSCWFVASNPENAVNIHQIATIIRGSAKDLEDKPFFRIGAASNSILGFQKDEIELLMKCAELGIPTGCEHYPIMGLTAPLSISAALAITNANYLCAHVIKKSIDPDNQDVYPVMAGSFNMRNAEIITSSPEIWHYYLTGIKLGQYYGIPTFVLGASDSKNMDIQAVFEKTCAFFIAASAGVNNIFAATNDLDAMNLASYEMAAVEMEILSSLAHYFKGIRVNSTQMDFDLIKRGLDKKMYYLEDDYTASNFRDFIWSTDIFIKDNYLNWVKNGMPEVRKYAHEKITMILNKHEPKQLPPDVLKEIGQFISKVKIH